MKRICWITEMRACALLSAAAVLVLSAGLADAAEIQSRKRRLSARLVTVREVYPKPNTPHRWRGNRISSCSGN